LRVHICLTQRRKERQEFFWKSFASLAAWRENFVYIQSETVTSIAEAKRLRAEAVPVVAEAQVQVEWMMLREGA